MSGHVGKGARKGRARIRSTLSEVFGEARASAVDRVLAESFWSTDHPASHRAPAERPSRDLPASSTGGAGEAAARVVPLALVRAHHRP